jgi:cation transport regulator
VPYSSIKDLPSSTDGLPAQAKRLFLRVFNAALKEYGNESSAFAVAWSAVKRAYEKKDGEWHKKEGHITGFFTGSVEIGPVPEDDEDILRLFGARPVAGELLYFKGVLARAETNKNHDEIDAQGVTEIAETLPLMPLDIEHRDREVCGFFLRAKPEEDGTAVGVEGLIFARRFPEVADGTEDGTLKLSIEAVAQEAECSICESIFRKNSDYCEHLKNRFRGKAVRKLHGMTARGGAVTETPAGTNTDIDSDSLLMVATDDIQDATESDKKAQQARAKKYGIGIKESGNINKPSKWEDLPDGAFADPTNYAFSVHDKSHADNAAVRWENSEIRSKYSKKEQAIIARRIERAQRKFGEDVDDKSDNDGSIDALWAELDVLSAALAVLGVEEGSVLKHMSFEAMRDKAHKKMRQIMASKGEEGWGYIAETYPDHMIWVQESIAGDSKTYKMPMSFDDAGECQMCVDDMQEVENSWQPVEGMEHPDLTIRALNIKIVEMETQVTELTAKAQTANISVDVSEEVKAELETVKASVQTLTEQLETAKAEAETLKGERDGFVSKQGELETQASTLVGERDTLNTQIESLKGVVERLSNELKARQDEARILALAEVIGEDEATKQREAVIQMAEEAFQTLLGSVKIAAGKAKPKAGQLKGVFVLDGHSNGHSNEPVTTVKGAFKIEK